MIYLLCLASHFTFVGLHYIHLMAINLIAMLIMALGLNRIIFRQNAKWDAHTVFGKA